MAGSSQDAVPYASSRDGSLRRFSRPSSIPIFRVVLTIGRDEFIASKRAAGRTKDLLDIALLEELERNKDRAWEASWAARGIIAPHAGRR